MWTKYSEQKPRHGQVVLACAKAGRQRTVVVAWLLNDDQWIVEYAKPGTAGDAILESGLDLKVTHWQQFPSLPND